MSEENGNLLKYKVEQLKETQDKTVDKLEALTDKISKIGDGLMEHVVRCDEQKKAVAKTQAQREKDREKKEATRFKWIVGGGGTGIAAIGWNDIVELLKLAFGG